MPHTPEQVSRALSPVGLAAELEEAPATEEEALATDPDPQANADAGASWVQIVVAVYNTVKKAIEVGRTLILIWKGGKWVLVKLNPGVTTRPAVVYSTDYKRLLYLKPDGSYKMGNVIMD